MKAEISQKFTKGIIPCTKKQLKFSALLVFLIVLQGCTVYKSSPVSLEQAELSGTKVKVVSKGGEKSKFKHIEQANGHYYGIKKTNQKDGRQLLEESNISQVHVMDKKTSTILTVFSFLVVAGAVHYIYNNYVNISMWSNRDD